MSRVGGIVLAAGAASRFGSPKQLAPLHGRPLLEHACAAMSAVRDLDPRVVVLGGSANAVLEAVDLHGAKAVVCEAWATGLAASLACGIDALGDVDAALITLGDQPGIRSPTLEAVLERGRDGQPVRATYGGLPGHPVLIPAFLFDRVRALEGDRGARDLLTEHGVVEIECAELGDPHDIDTEADLRAAEQLP